VGPEAPHVIHPRGGKDHQRQELVVGEVSGLGVSTTMLPTARRVRCTRWMSQWSTGMGLPVVMAEQRRYSSATHGYRPCQGTRVQARAPWCEDDNGAQDRREREQGQRGLRPRAVVNGGHGAMAEETPKWALPRAKTVARAVGEAGAARGGAVGACW
jgi:hypothetical protein